MSKVVSLESLAQEIPSGATIAIGGFQLSRVPIALIHAIAAGKNTDFKAVSAPNPLALEILSAAGCLRSAECAFIGFQYEDGFAIAPAVCHAIATGELDLQQPDVYDTIQSLRATRDKGRQYADFALLHAQLADRTGNLLIDDPYVDVLLAEASGGVLATAETLVERIDKPTIPGSRVQQIALEKNGAVPTACLGHYGRDALGVRQHIGERVARQPDPTPSQTCAIDNFLINLARQVNDNEVIVTGLASAIPMLAIELARRTHAPKLTYINCIGAVNPRVEKVFPTSVEAGLRNHCDDTIELPDLFDLARDGGVDTMFFGAAQIDRQGNINLSRIGPESNPKVRLAGPAGSSSMRSYIRRALIAVPRQLRRNLVECVDIKTSCPASCNKETILVTDAAIWQLKDNGFEPASMHQGISKEELSSRTGFDFQCGSPSVTPPATQLELSTLRAIDPAGSRYKLFSEAPQPADAKDN
jgi:glutaconate CoA-transferase subunit B